MTHSIDDQLLSQLSGFITARFGLHFPKKRWRDLERGITGAAGDFGFDDISSCIRWLITAQLTKSQLDILVCRLTIGETYFFRERKSFDVLEARILPALINSRRGKEQRLRIWSAGCSTGEEAYSIAILLYRLIADLPQWNITILATDVNPASLCKADRGEYSDWSFRGIPQWIKEKFFSRNAEGRFEVADTIRKMVTFASLNLADDPFPSLINNTNAMDIIFCRNVLMYFAPHQVKKVIDNFHH
jgi:chemotaxis protein methyltransferase CheR